MENDTPELVRIRCLDRGFVELVDVMGDDQAIVDAARVSIAGENVKAKSQDEGLIRYLYRNRHCYTPEMQVLTLRGWLRWDECEPEEEFLVPDPKSRTLRRERCATEVFSADEDLSCFESQRMSYRVTSDHRMYFRGKYQSEFSIVRAGKMSKWGHFDPLRGYRMHTRDLKNGDAEAELVGFYLGDGSYASAHTVTFHLRKSRKRDYLESLLHRISASYNVKQSSTHDDAIVVTVRTPPFFETWLGQAMSARAAEKRLQLHVGGLSETQVNGLLHGLIQSDGSHDEKGRRISFSSVSPHLLRLFETLSAMVGMDAHANAHENEVTAFYGDRTSLEARAQYFYTHHYTGKVFCATTSTGLLMVRGGSDKFAFVCGNTTPFEMVELKFRCKMPIFVARQWIRHRTANVNEMSARYSELPNECYLPEDLRFQSKDNKQASEGVLEGAGELRERMRVEQEAVFDSYAHYLRSGVAREQARIDLPLATYTQWIWKIDLHNLFHFLALRLHSHAQYEIRVFAEAMARLVKPHVPLAWQAFEDYRLNAMQLTAHDVAALRSLLTDLDRQGGAVGVTGDDARALPNDMFPSSRERMEFITKIETIIGQS